MIRVTSQTIRGAIFVGAAIMLTVFSNPADARANPVVAKVDTLEQRVNVFVNGVRLQRFKVSMVGKG